MSSSSRSIRSRLTRSLLAGAGVLLVVAAVALDVVVTRSLTDLFDEWLEAKALALVALTTEDEEDGIEFDLTESQVLGFGDDDESDAFGVWIDGASLVASAHAAELPRDEEWDDDARFADLELEDGRAGRLVQVDFHPQFMPADEDDFDAEGEDDDAEEDQDEPGDRDDPDEPDEDDEEVEDEDERDGALYSSHRATIVVTTAREPLDEAIVAFRVTLAAIGIALVLVVIVLVRLSVTSGLRPLTAVGRQVAAVDAEHLSSRLSTDRVPEEIVPLVERINALLDRLEAAFARERRFSADVAHELRTPVAELRNLAEVGTRWPGDRESATAFFDDTLQIAVQMDGIVSNLSALTRLDAGQEQVESESVDLGDLVARVWRRLESESIRRRIDLDPRFDGPVTAITDPSKVELLVSNLLGNAVAHAPEGSLVSCGTLDRGEQIDLWVTNPAPELAEGDLDSMFDRLWQKDASRTEGRHSGLGLSLVRAFSELLGLQVRPTLVDGRLTMTLAGFPTDR